MAKRILDYLAPYKIRVIDSLDAPILTATVEGDTSGTTKYIYSVSFETLVGQTLMATPVTVLNGFASMGGFNKIRLSVSEIPETVTLVRYWKNVWSYTTDTLRTPSTSYDLNDYVVLNVTSDVRYKCTTAGASSENAASGWTTTIGDTVTDGNVVWTVESNITDDWQIVGEVSPSVGQVYDIGGALTTGTIPDENTSGRPDVIAIGCKPGTLIQRQTWEDLQGIFFRMIQDLGDLTHKDGDIREGCKEFFKSGTTWGFTPGSIYFMGRFVSVPEGEITLTGTGTEQVGLTITPFYSTSTYDVVQKPSADEGVPARYANAGPDWLYFQFSYVKDTNGMILIKEFYNNSPKKVTLTPERTLMESFVADKINDLAGHFVVDRFPMAVEEHPTDSTKLMLNLKRGKAYPNGYKTVIEGGRSLPFNKARSIREVANSDLTGYVVNGASNGWNYWEKATETALNTIVVPTILNGYRYKATDRALDYLTANREPIWPETPGSTVVDGNVTWTCLYNDYDLNTLTLIVKVGDGNTRTVTFSSNNLTASAVAVAIESAINATVNLVEAVSDGAILQIQALDPKPITISGTALTQLAWTSGTTQTTGIRVYPVGNDFVKTVSDLSYQTEYVIPVTRSTVNSYDVIEASSILGGSDTEANCNDGIYDYVINEDFYVTNEGNISFEGISGTPPTPGDDYYLKCRRNYTATKGTRQLVRVENAPVVRSSSGDVDNLTFSTTQYRVLNNNAMSLVGSPSNVIRILRVTTTDSHTESDYDIYALVSNSDASSHSTSQISWENAGSPGTTGTGRPSDGNTYYVTYEMWYHSSEGDYVSGDSYDMYEKVEPFGDYVLRDCIDFRTTTETLPVPNYNTVLDYTHYLPRIDKVMLDDFGNFYIVEGESALKPTIPNDQADRLSIAILRIAPYTYTPSWVTIVSVEPTVIKQEDMRSILKRLDHLEYWKAVTDLEQEVAGNAVSADAVGIYTNALTGFNKFDLNFYRYARVGTSDNVDVRHSLALDIHKQCLLLPATPEMKELTINETDSVGIKQVGNTLMIDYDSELFLEQPYATESVNCAMDYDYDNYRGTLTISPASDVFVDKEQLPSIHLDFDNNLQPLVDALVDQGALRLNEMVWSDWNTSYSNNIWNTLANTAAGGAYWYDDATGEYGYGNFVYGWGDMDAAFDAYYAYTPNRSYIGPSSRGSTTQRRWRDGVSRSLVPGTTTESLGSSVVNFAKVGKLRTKYDDGSAFIIYVEASNLLPNQDHAVTISGKAVNFSHDTNPPSGTQRGAAGDVGHTYQGCTTVKSDNTGRLTGKFTVPTGVDAGSVAIEVFYYATPSFSNASAYFNSAGYVQQSRETTIGMPTFCYTRKNFHEESTRTVYHNYYDPLAQTFVIYDEIQYISEVGIFFRTKHDTLPIRLEIRNTVNGEPGPEILATSIVEAASVTCSEDASAETIFELDAVIGYNKGSEFSIVLFPQQNNTDYTVWTAKVGGVDVKTGSLVTGQTNDGVLFHSPNNRVWEPMTKQDLKFKLYRSNFRDNASFIFEQITSIDAAAFVAAVQEFAAPGTDVKWFYKPYWTEGDVETPSWTPFYPNVDTYMETSLKRITLKADVSSLGGSYQMVFPYTGIVFMLHKTSGWAVFPNEDFIDPLDYPNTVKCYVDIDKADGVTEVSPYYSYDNGYTLVEIEQDITAEPSFVSGVYYKYLFTTPSPATIISTANATASGPIVVTSTGHKFKENAMVTITGVVGDDNANGTFIIRGVTDDTVSLYDSVTKEAVVGTGAGTGGTMSIAELSQCRTFLYATTSNQARTPRIKNVAFVVSQV